MISIFKINNLSMNKNRKYNLKDRVVWNDEIQIIDGYHYDSSIDEWKYTFESGLGWFWSRYHYLVKRKFVDWGYYDCRHPMESLYKLIGCEEEIKYRDYTFNSNSTIIISTDGQMHFASYQHFKSGFYETYEKAASAATRMAKYLNKLLVEYEVVEDFMVGGVRYNEGKMEFESLSKN